MGKITLEKKVKRHSTMSQDLLLAFWRHIDQWDRIERLGTDPSIKGCLVYDTSGIPE